MTPLEKFATAVSKTVQEDPSFFLMQKGSVAIEVGVGQQFLTIRFGDDLRPMEYAFDDDADLLLWFTDQAFQGFIDGSLDADVALENECILPYGDMQLLGTLSTLLQTKQSWLGIRRF